MTEIDEPTSSLEEHGDEASFSSPPCFMHELRPEYLGYMSEVEISDLLAEVRELQAPWGADAETARRSLCCRLKQCLSRIYPSTVRDELELQLRRLEAEIR